MNEIAKSLFQDHWKGIVIIVLSFLLFKSCQNVTQLQESNKEKVKELIKNSDLLLSKNHQLFAKIVQLESQKQKVKTEVAYVQNKTKSDTKKAQSLSVNEMAKFYEQRYNVDVLHNQKGIVLTDTVAKKNIIELVQKDGCFNEIKLVEKALEIEEDKGFVKDTIISNYGKSTILLKDAIATQDIIIKNTENSVKKEKRKKTFWQIATGAVLIGGSFLLIK